MPSEQQSHQQNSRATNRTAIACVARLWGHSTAAQMLGIDGKPGRALAEVVRACRWHGLLVQLKHWSVYTWLAHTGIAWSMPQA